GSRAPTGRSRRQDARSEQIRATRFSHRMARKDSRRRDSMKLITRLGAFALAALIGSPLVLAQADKSEEAAPAKPRESAGPMPSAELKKVAYMAGDWTCTGKTFASPMGPEHPVDATVHARWQLGGFWLRSQYREKKTAQNPMPIFADEYWSHDAKAGWEKVAL